MLLGQLPKESRLKTALIDAEPEDRWSSTDYLLAHLIDLIRDVAIALMYKGSGKKPPNDSKSYPRPTDKLTKKSAAVHALDSRADIFAGLKDRAIAEGQIPSVPESESGEADPVP